MNYQTLYCLQEAINTRRGVYHSRTRGLWKKGETSGAHQELLAIDLDCDRDTIRFTVKQHGAGFCHQNTRTCWGETRGISALERTLKARKDSAPEGSYTARLFNDPVLLGKKLQEEAKELIEAETPEEVAAEAADLLYFLLTAATRGDAGIFEIEKVLDRRALKIVRRPGNAKE